MDKLNVRVREAKKAEAENVILRAENKKLRCNQKAQQQTASSPTSVADGIVKLGKDTMPGQHKETKAKAIIDNLEIAYGDAAKVSIESKVAAAMGERGYGREIRRCCHSAEG